MLRLRARASLSALAMCASLMCAACTAAEDLDREGPGAQPRARRGGSLAFGVLGAPATLDPYSRVASDLTYALARPIYPSLFRLLPNGDTEPDLARSIERVPDGFDVKLARARWSDGEPITAGDVVASARRASSRSGFSAFADVRAAGSRRVSLRGRVRDPEVALATAAFVLPGGSVERGGRVAGGPFRVARQRPGLEIILEPNRQWRGSTPNLSRIAVRFVEDVRTMLELLESGRLDGAAPSSTVNLGAISPEGMTIEGRLGWESVYLDFRGSGLDRAERAAVAGGLDADLLEETFVRDDGRVSSTIGPAPGPGGAAGPWADALGSAESPGDVVLVSAPDGDELLGLIQRAAYEQLTERGLSIELASVDATTFYGPWRGANPSDVAIRREAGAPPYAAPSEGVDRLDTYPLFHVETFVAWRNYAHGLEPNPTTDGPLWNAAEWWVGGPG